MSAIASAKALSRRAAGAPSDLMINGDRETDPLLEDDRPVRARGGARHDGVHAEDGHLGSVEHRREGLDAEGAEVAHGEGPARELVGIDVPGLTGRGERAWPGPKSRRARGDRRRVSLVP